MRTSRNLTLAGLAAAFSLATNVAMADDPCTIGNWSSAVELTDDAVGTPSNDNRRFAGPCGLRVPVDGTARYLVDDSPSAETSYNARFYFFVNGALPNEAVIFSARTAADGADVLRLRNTSSGMVLDGAGSSAFVSSSATALSSGWNVVKITWNQSSASMSLNGAEAQSITSGLDQSLTIGAVRLGNVSGATGSSVSIDFDEFDSRRASAPPTLCRGLTDINRPVAPGQTEQSLSVADVQAIFNEIASRGQQPAGGQPDFNKDGQVTIADVQAVFDRIAGRQASCAVNR